MTAGNKGKQMVASIKQGLSDLQLVIVEGNSIKLLIKPLIVVVILVFGYRYLAGSLQARNEDIVSQNEALQAQQKNEKEYLESKRKLLALEPRFPDISAKKSWLASQIEEIFKGSSIDDPKVSSTQTEDASNSGYTVASRQVDMETSYPEFGKLLAAIEGRDMFLRVSEFSIEKSTSPDKLGLNTIKMRLNTVFPAEKVAQTLFKEKTDTKKRGKK